MATTASSQNASPALTFPRPIFAAISPHPFLQAHLSTASPSGKKSLRANGRTTHEFRTPGLNTGSVTHCNGSAVVRLGNTSVVCGVRAEILKEGDISGEIAYTAPAESSEEESTDAADSHDAASSEEESDNEISHHGLLVPNIELSTGSTPAHIPGNAPSSYAQTLITRIRSLLYSTRVLRARDLRILHTPSTNPDDPDAPAPTQLKGYWVLYLDVFFISLDGNAFDAAWLAILAALRDTLLPRAYFDEEYEGILCSDERGEARRLRLRTLPVASTFAVFEARSDEGGAQGSVEQWVLSDADAFEESVCAETVCVVVDGADAGGAVSRIEKSGGGVVGREEMKGLVQRAKKRWVEVTRLLA